jgi:hypothetical protein
MIAVTDAGMAARLQDFRREQEETVRNMKLPPQ